MISIFLLESSSIYFYSLYKSSVRGVEIVHLTIALKVNFGFWLFCDTKLNETFDMAKYFVGNNLTFSERLLELSV